MSKTKAHQQEEQRTDARRGDPIDHVVTGLRAGNV
jgi:hypothetical protein